MYHQSLINDLISDDVQVAKEADTICTIKANLNNFGKVDCIIDSGSQVVAISEAMAVKFGLTWDPQITLKMAELATKSSMIPNDVTSILSCSTSPLVGSSLSESIPYPQPQAKISPSETPGLESTREFTKASLAYLYLHAGSMPKIAIPPSKNTTSYLTYTAETQLKIKGVQVKKKYKPVALRTKPVAASIPDSFQIKCNIIGDPLRDIPILSVNPPPYIPTGQFNQEQKDQFVETHDNGFLSKSKINLFIHLMCLQNKGFAWDDSEWGNFQNDFFKPVKIPTIPHVPWIKQNILFSQDFIMKSAKSLGPSFKLESTSPQIWPIIQNGSVS
ncbi:hypothetical protein C0991_005184 [Blastosporella zonata]|nr:hypothetical protein C0991_005184 [Blastosporella zonata]